MTKNLLIQFIDSCDDGILLLKNTAKIDSTNDSSITLLESNFLNYVDNSSQSTYKVFHMNPVYKDSFLSLYPQKMYKDFNIEDENINKNVYSRLVQHKELLTNNKVIYIHGYPINALYYVLLFRDITKQYKTREMINKNKLLLEGVFENSFSALCVSSLNGDIIKFNRRFYSHLLSNYEFNFTVGNKGKIYELPCFNTNEITKAINFYNGEKYKGCKIGEFYFTPYLSSDNQGSYVLIELRLDQKTALKEAVLADLPDANSRTLLSNLESDVIRLQKRVFEDKDSISSTLIKLKGDIIELQTLSDRLKPLEDVKGFINVVNWASVNIPWKLIIGLTLILYTGFKIPPVNRYIIDYLELELHKSN